MQTSGKFDRISQSKTNPDRRRAFFDDPNDPETRRRRREWNRGPLNDLFPRIPRTSLEAILDACIEKNVIYDLSAGKQWNSRRLTGVVVAHVRHNHSEYDRLLREEGMERYEARRRTGHDVWKTLRAWCPWEDSNDVLEQCFEATLLPRSQRANAWDPMELDTVIDSDSDRDMDPMELD